VTLLQTIEQNVTKIEFIFFSVLKFAIIKNSFCCLLSISAR